MITQEYLKQLFDYKDGQLYWKLQKAKRTKIGSIAGAINSDVHGQNYRIVEIDSKSYKIHRLIFMYHYGYLPSRIDHIDGNRLNNCIENLREATASENAFNSKFRKSNTSGYKNVFKDKNKWRVQLCIDGKNLSFGSFEDLELAGLVAEEARNKYCGQFVRHF
jgi:hypothetical protein